ncbi:Nudix hydrolase domain-containing protein [Aphelenchoides bicaudatus]|nr:Nudix hydrolase domain-containing protein [Aphelenchoides bicaudatus]
MVFGQSRAQNSPNRNLFAHFSRLCMQILRRPLNPVVKGQQQMSKITNSNSLHTKCRSTDKPYLKSQVYRFKVPDDKVLWNVAFDEYNPIEYTDESTKGKPWADPDITSDSKFKWNSIDGDIDRTSHVGKYEIVDGRPRNVCGRTGLKGRGILGKWGPNHAADPIVSRIINGQLQIVAIQRHDTGEWALPGGMVDAGEKVSATLKREFTEEALDGVNDEQLDSLWTKGTEIYKGYVDDPRNTDNSWMETVAVNFHDDSGLLDKAKFKAGDDAKNVKFVDVTPDLDLYASHVFVIRKLAELHGFKI